MKYKYKVNGLDCANCTQKLEDALNKKEEINDCVISFATGMMTFESNQEINDNELLCFMQSIEDEEYVTSYMILGIFLFLFGLRIIFLYI